MIPVGPERWARIEAVLDAALDRPDTERGDVLDALCADDAELRREVERLLRSIDSADSAFERPPAQVIEAATAAAPRDQFQSGDVVGAYRVVGLLGRGGMGAVYLAERADGAFDRQVALKVVKRGMDTDEILDRFRRERQILARLEHANIAGLLDGGITATGLPFFAMELARGRPIDEWCDAHQLTIEQRLQLFLPVCDAVQHAHRSLIVHRDLKPGNILIVDGEPKLLDFGIAKVLHADGDDEEEPATRVQERRLTPQYAAPEQLRNEPTTTATDVYALGVILYELLTGRPPYRLHGGLGQIEHIVCTELPRAPSNVAGHDRAGEETVRQAELRGTLPRDLRTRLHGDLDAIIMKALEKEPERRYASVEALAADIRRHLAGRPVMARPATSWYRVRKFVGRNQALVGLALSAALALVLGAGMALWQAGRAREESRRAQEEAARATAARDYLIDLFADLNPDALAGRRTFTLDELIELSVANLAGLEDQPILRAGVMNAVGSVVFNLGDYAKADSLFNEAAALLTPRGPSLELALSMTGLGEVDRRQLRFDTAVALFESALRMRSDMLPPDDPRIAESMRALAFAYYNAGSYEAAESMYERVLGFANATPDVRSSALEGLGDIAVGRARAATDSVTRAAAYGEAATQYERAIAQRRELRQGRSPDAARAMWGLAEAHSALGVHERAVARMQEAVSILVETYGEDHPDLLPARFYFGMVLDGAGEPALSAEQFELAAELGERFHGPDYLISAEARARGGVQLLEAGRTDEARESLERAATVLRPLSADAANTRARFSLADIHHQIGMWAAGEGRVEEAVRELREAWRRWTELGNDRMASRTAADLATVFERGGRADSAAVWRARAY